MKRNRLFVLALAGVTAFALTACGGDDTEAPATSASATTAPATTSAAPTPDASAPAAADAGGDKEICEAVKKAGDESKQVLFDALQDGKEPTVKMLSETYTDMAVALGKAADAASTDSKVANAVKEFQTAVTEVAESSDPVAAGDKPAFQKTAANLTAACKETGVDINF
ncbi:hypothetical protein JMF97_06640 [Micromonospora fiedleri]|uniref:Lipoprotein n=1 Tax=Micromonospora fiedleri TaxID=1157498 RepID=A0ABS1UHL8_9ACTN|nr:MULTISPECIES: hypothetical protein [Micromonospora]MBL6275836.1 hypothetical protein [Micromonospora fiedleri]WSK41942.1 hypothetical protein OG712_26205 [Micromonospora maris]